MSIASWLVRPSDHCCAADSSMTDTILRPPFLASGEPRLSNAAIICCLERQRKAVKVMALLSIFWRPVLILEHTFRDYFPFCFGANINVHTKLYLRITIYTAQCDSVNNSGVNATNS